MAQIQSGATPDLLTVDPTSKAGRFTLYDVSGNPIVRKDKEFTSAMTGLQIMGAGDGNSIPIRTDQMGNIGVSSVLPIMWEQFEGAASLNAQRWANTATTFASAANSTGVNLNNTNITTANAVNVMLARKQVIRTARSPLYYKSRIRASNFANSVSDWGVADTVTGTTTIPNGAFFQIASGGALQAVISTIGTPVALNIEWTGTPFDQARFYTYTIMIDDDSAMFTVQDTSTGQIVGVRSMNLPNSAARLFAATHLRAFNRLYNGGVAPATAPVHVCAFVFVGLIDSLMARPMSEVLAANHYHSGVQPTSGTQIAQYANSAEPGSATLSNTVAGYAALGGKFQFAAVAGSATDYALFGIQSPAPFTMVIKSITIDAWVVGAAIATTPTTLTWSTFANSPAASLVSTAPGNRQHLGAQSFPVGAVVGSLATTIQKRYDVPLITEGANFFLIAIRIPVATATASQIIAGAIQVDGYFE